MPEQQNEKLFDTNVKEAFAQCDGEDDMWNSLTEEEKAIILKNEETIYKKIEKTITASKHKKHRRITIGLVAAIILILAAAMNVSAVRSFLYKNYFNMQYDTLHISTERETVSYGEITKFKNKKDIIIPSWLPEGMTLVDVEDDEDFLSISYELEEYYLNIHYISPPGNSDVAISAGKNDTEIINSSILGLEATTVYSKSEMGLERYFTVWLSNTCEYRLTTNLPKAEFQKILKKLKYL